MYVDFSLQRTYFYEENGKFHQLTAFIWGKQILAIRYFSENPITSPNITPALERIVGVHDMRTTLQSPICNEYQTQ